MKKSPLSMPSGSRGKQNYNWKSQEHKNRTGYSYIKSDSYQCVSPNGSKAHYGDDFIPLNNSTPVQEQKRQNGNWYGSGGSRNHRNTGSGGFNHYRNNYHATPKSNYNNSYSPYKHSGKQFHGQKKGYQRDARRHIDISRYVDMKSFLEDPWAELTKKLNESREADDRKSPKIEHSLPLQSVYVDSKQDLERKSATSFSDLQFNRDSKNESSIDVTLGLDDTDISEMSKAESSIDLKLDSVTFNQDSKNESSIGTNDSANEDAREEDSVHLSRDSETRTYQKSI